MPLSVLELPTNQPVAQRYTKLKKQREAPMIYINEPENPFIYTNLEEPTWGEH